MAKTGDTPDRKIKPKPRSRTTRPSFSPPAATADGPAWVYRSEGKATTRSATAAQSVTGATSVPASATNSSRVSHALDVVTLPIAVSLMAVLAPMRRLLGPRH